MATTHRQLNWYSNDINGGVSGQMDPVVPKKYDWGMIFQGVSRTFSDSGHGSRGWDVVGTSCELNVFLPPKNS